MKELRLLEVMLLSVFSIFMVEACSSDDDNGDDISYTSNEIIEILTGKWEIYGHVRISGDTDRMVDSDYTGTIEFKSDQKYSANSSVISTTEIQNNKSGKTYTINNDISDYLGDASYHKYSIIRKNDRYYIEFAHATFQIISLTKKSFKLIMDEDVAWGSLDDLHYAHQYISIISK